MINFSKITFHNLASKFEKQAENSDISATRADKNEKCNFLIKRCDIPVSACRGSWWWPGTCRWGRSVPHSHESPGGILINSYG